MRIHSPGSGTRTSNNSATPSTYQLRNDRLGTSVANLVSLFKAEQDWESLVRAYRGRSYLSPTVGEIDHPAAPLLHQWMSDGVPVHTADQPWPSALKEERFNRGCHQSANEHREFLRDELATFMDNRFWMVLLYDLVRDLEQLQLSPAGVKPERDRQPRLICDHS